MHPFPAVQPALWHLNRDWPKAFAPGVRPGASAVFRQSQLKSAASFPGCLFPLGPPVSKLCISSSLVQDGALNNPAKSGFYQIYQPINKKL
jgi:hypothetical protein